MDLQVTLSLRVVAAQCFQCAWLELDTLAKPNKGHRHAFVPGYSGHTT